MAEQDDEIARLRAELKGVRAVVKELTPPLEALLRRRGFRIYKKEPLDDLLLPDERSLDSYYGMLKHYSFRLFLRDVIKEQPLFTPAGVARYATKEVTGGYLASLVEIGLAVSERDGYRLAKGPVKSFGATLEWFVAELMKREFSAEAVWGVKVKRPRVGGDYDLLAKLDGAILYMEVKSSPPKQIYLQEIAAFLDRTSDLMPGLAIFFVDTELRMKDKIVPLFEEALRARFPAVAGPERIEKELFELTGAGTNMPYLFIINAKDSIEGNLERVLARYYRTRGRARQGGVDVR